MFGSPRRQHRVIDDIVHITNAEGFQDKVEA